MDVVWPHHRAATILEVSREGTFQRGYLEFFISKQIRGKERKIITNINT